MPRKQLIRLFIDKKVRKGAEVGTQRGIFAEELCKSIPELKLYCIDPWQAYSDYPSRESQHDFNVNYHNTVKRLAPYNCEVIRKTSMEAVKDFNNSSLDFVYIDGNHNFKFVFEDIVEWAQKVKKGGIVCGDDYHWYDKHQVRFDVMGAVMLYSRLYQVDIQLFENGRSVNWLFIK